MKKFKDYLTPKAVQKEIYKQQRQFKQPNKQQKTPTFITKGTIRTKVKAHPKEWQNEMVKDLKK